MTSNVGAEKLQKEASFGFSVSNKESAENLDELHTENKDKVLKDLKKLMRPELLNRVDKTIVFRALTHDDALRIMDLQLEDLKKRLIKKGLSITVNRNAKMLMLEKGYDAKNGVRPMRRLIQDEIEDNIAEGLLDESYQKGDIINIGVSKNRLSFSVKHEKEIVSKK